MVRFGGGGGGGDASFDPFPWKYVRRRVQEPRRTPCVQCWFCARTAIIPRHGRTAVGLFVFVFHVVPIWTGIPKEVSVYDQPLDTRARACNVDPL